MQNTIGNIFLTLLNRYARSIVHSASVLLSGCEKITPPEWYSADLERVTLKVRFFCLLILPLTFILCGCSDSVSPLTGIYSESSTDEVIHICTDHTFIYFVDGGAVSGVYELLNDTTLALYTMIDDGEPLVVDTFIVRYRKDNKYDLIAPRTHECFKGL